jgi:hypothetical protein
LSTDIPDIYHVFFVLTLIQFPIGAFLSETSLWVSKPVCALQGGTVGPSPNPQPGKQLYIT